MADRTPAQAHHAELVAEAKKQLGKVPGHLRGELARFLDLGEQPRELLCAVLDNELCLTLTLVSDVQALPGLVEWLCTDAPEECWGSYATRVEWQARVAAIASGGDVDEEPEDNEPHDTERPPLPSVDLGDVRWGDATEWTIGGGAENA